MEAEGVSSLLAGRTKPRWSSSSRVTTSDTEDESELPDLPSLLPLSHDHPLLSSEASEWDVDEFLLTRLHIPLEELRGELRAYLGSLKVELGGLINDDYEEFISLGLGLRGEGRRLEELRYPLEALKTEVLDIHSKLHSSQINLQEKLDDRNALRSERTILDTLQHLTESLTRTEGLLGISSNRSHLSAAVNGVQTNGPSSKEPSNRRGVPKLAIISDADEISGESKDIKTVTRIANEYTQVMYLVAKAAAEGCEFVSSAEGGIELRTSNIREALQADLAGILKSAIQPQTSFGQNRKATPEQRKGVIQNCLEVYDSIEGWAEAELVVCRIVETDMLKYIDSRFLLNGSTPGVPATPYPLRDINPMSPTPITPTTPKSAFPPSSGNIFESTLSPISSRAKKSTEMRVLDESLGPIATILNDILEYVETTLIDLLRCSETIRQKQRLRRTADGSDAEAAMESIPNEDGQSELGPRFRFLANSVWQPIGQRIMEELGSILFAAGRVADLHQNYTLCHKFIDRLESLASSVPAVVEMRSSETYLTFEKKWQLPVYFQLRWKDIVKALEEGLQIPPTGIFMEKGANGWALSQTAATVTALEACWSRALYIPELAYRFWRLYLQIISRYKTFLEAAVPVLYDQSDNEPPSARNSLSIQRSSISMTGPVLPTGDPSADPASAMAEERILKVSSMIARDLSKMHRFISSHWNDHVKDMLSETMTADEIRRLDTTLQHSLSGLSALFDAPSAQIVSILSRRCTEPLKLVRSMASQLRAVSTVTTKDDIKPSHFIPNVVNPLKEYFRKAELGQALYDDVGYAWSRKVLEEIVSSYTSVLASVQKTESALRRHRKGKKNTFSLFGGGGNASALSVEEEEKRFRNQMLTDIEALAQSAREIGIDVQEGTEDELPGWKTLLETAETSDSG